jgi:DnaJ family protein B protein 12
MGLLPILLLFIFPILTSLFSGGSSPPAVPSMVFDYPQPPVFTLERTMPTIDAKYYVNPDDVAQYSKYKLSQLDKTAEITLVGRVRVECEHEMLHKQRLREAAQGWFFQDPDKMAMAEKVEMPNCKRLQTFGRV